MATFTGLRVQDTYNAIIKIGDNSSLTGTAKLLSDGFGNSSSIYLSTTRLGIGVTPTENLHIGGSMRLTGIFRDKNNEAGTSGQVLTSTATGTDWKTIADIDGVTSATGGTANYVPVFTSSSNIENSIIQASATLVTISGNLDVNGTVTYIDTIDLSVKDPLIKLANANASNTLDIGFYGKYVVSATTKYLGLYSDASDSNKFRLFTGLEVEPTTVVDSSQATFAVGTLIANFEGNLIGNVTGNLTGTATATSILADGVIATTQAVGDSTTKIATTAFVLANSGGGDILGSGTGGKVPLWSGSGTSVTLTDSAITEESTRFVLTKDIYINEGIPTITLSDSDSAGSATLGDIIWQDNTASQRAIISLTSNVLGITSKHGGLTLATNSTNAVTIDAVQRATFAGDIEIEGTVYANDNVVVLNASNPYIAVEDSTNNTRISLQALDSSTKLDFNAPLNFEYDNTIIQRIESTGIIITGTINSGSITSTGTINSGDITSSGNQYFNGSFIEGDGKEMFRYSDTWLRINEDNDFTDGIYCGTGILRTDGIFQIGSGGTKVTVDASGSMGIGTSSPNTQLQVFGTDPVLRISDDGTTGLSSLQLLQQNVTTEGFDLIYNSGTGDTHFNNIYSAGSIKFHTAVGSLGNTSINTRMVINSSGNVAIGGTLGTDSQFRVELKPGATILAGLRVGYNNSSNNYYDADTHHFRAGSGAADLVVIDSAGTITSGAITSTGVITATGGNSTQWNTAYANQGNYLPLAGGTLTGALVATTIRSDDLFTKGMIRATGWYNTNTGNGTGYGVEIGQSGGQGYILSYSRDAGAYQILNLSGTYTNINNATRSPIYYDSDDTGYWVNPNSISSLYGVAIRGDASPSATPNQIFFWGNSGTTTSAIGFKSNAGNFANPTGQGDGYNTYLTMDTANRGWVFRRGTGGTDFTAAYTSGWILNTGEWQANLSMKAPIYYDSANTAYYGDFAGQSILSSFKISGSAGPLFNIYNDRNVRITGGSSSDVGLSLVGSGGGHRVQLYGSGSDYGFLNGEWGSWDIRKVKNGNLYLNNSTTYYLNPPSISILNDVRANIYYDQNNTAYYGDFAGTSYISSLKSSNGIMDPSYNRFYSPGGAHYATSSSSITGAFQIKLPSGSQAKYPMLQFTINIFNYSTGTSLQIRVAGHISGSDWHNWSAYGIGDTAPVYTIRFGHDNAGAACVWVGETNTAWIYPQVTVTDFQNGYSSIQEFWSTGWSITPVTSFGYVSRTRNACMAINTGDTNQYKGAFLQSNSSLRAPIFYDSNNTAYYGNFASTSALNAASFAGIIDANGGHGGINITHTSILSSATSNWTGNPGVAGKIQYHSNRWYIVGDSASNRIVQFRRNGTDTSYIANDGRFMGVGTSTTVSNLAPIYYDSANTAYYLDPAGYSNLSSGQLVATWTMGTQKSLVAGNYGSGVYGLYTSTRFQHVWSMGTSYNLAADGTGTGNLYGMAWSHPNAGGHAANLSTHGMLIINNGGFDAAISSSIRCTGDMRTPIYYDSNDTAYYADYAGYTYGKYYGRRSHSTGFQVGSYNSVGANSDKTNPIYTIGSAYMPTDTSLSSMYGIGYAHANLWGSGKTPGWGFYVTDNGTVNCTIGAGATTAWFQNIATSATSFRAPIFYDSTNTTYYTRPGTSSYMNSITTTGQIQCGTGGTGNLWVGNSGTTQKLRFHIASGANTYFDMDGGTIQWRQNNGVSTRYWFYMSTGNITVAGSLTQLSDSRLKENIVEIGGCIDKVKAMRGVYYNRTDINIDTKKVGVIAQEVEAVVPELVSENDDGHKAVSYSEISAVLINAIKEQQIIIEDLKLRLETLENN